MTPHANAARVYRALLLLLPEPLRRRHGDEMERVFLQMLGAARGGIRAKVWLIAVWDVGRTAWVERVRETLGAGSASAAGRRDGDEAREGMLVEDMIQDLKYSARQLLRRPGFAAVLVITLALGIGANTAVFSVVDGVLLRPLPYPAPDQLTVVWTQFPTQNLMEFPASWEEYRDYKEQSHSFADLALWGRTQRTLTGAGDAPERLNVAYATWTLFPVLGVSPAVGRAFSEAEDAPGSDNVVMLGHGLWVTRFGSDPSIVGKTVQLDGSTLEVVGVMPSGFSRRVR